MAYQEALSALADPTRRSILESLIGQSMTVGQLAEGRPISRPAVSQHLRVLETAQLVSFVPQGNRRVYSIKRDGLEDLRRYLDSFWSDALSAYSSEIKRQMKNNEEKGSA